MDVNVNWQLSVQWSIMRISLRSRTVTVRVAYASVHVAFRSAVLLKTQVPIELLVLPAAAPPPPRRRAALSEAWEEP